MKRRSLIVLKLAQGDLDVPFRLLEARATELLDGAIGLASLVGGGGSSRRGLGRRISGRFVGVRDTACEISHGGRKAS